MSFNKAGLPKFTFTYLADTFIQMSLQIMHMTGNLSYKPTFIVNIEYKCLKYKIGTQPRAEVKCKKEKKQHYNNIFYNV